MRKSILLLFFLIFTFSMGAFAGELDSALQNELANCQDDDFVPVIIFLKDQADIETLDQELTTMRATRKYRHEMVVRRLQEVAASTQDYLRTVLAEKAEAGKVENLRSYWLVNAFSASLKKEIISEVADHTDVQTIYFDAPMELIQSTGNVLRSTPRVGTEDNIAAIRAPECWEMGITGEGVLVAFLDTGVNADHPALGGRWRGNFAPPEECFFDTINPGNHTPIDYDVNYAHGTRVGGIITGLAEAIEDTIGIAWDACWIAATWYPGTLASLEFMADPDGDPQTVEDVPDVLNNSWLYLGDPCESTLYQAIDNCEAAGIILVFAIGNEGPNGPMGSPSARAETAYNTFVVGATHKTAPYNIAALSTRGPTPCADGDLAIKPEVSAPGMNIRSSAFDGYNVSSGTSYATNHVSGTLALMRQVNPNIEPDQAKQIVMETAHDLGSIGEDNYYGWGFIDAYEAVMATFATLIYFEGEVVNADTDEPIEWATVSTLEDSTLRTVTDANGYFSLLARPGEYHITAQHFAYEDYQTEISYTIDVAETLTVDDIAMEPIPTGTLTGRITDAYGDNIPIPDAALFILNTTLFQMTNSEGEYNFADVPMGTHVLSINSFNHLAIEADVIIDEDQTTVQNFQLIPIYSFEDDDGSFLGDGQWEWGEPQASGGPAGTYHGRYCWGTDLDSTYAGPDSMYLITTEYGLEAVEPPYELTFYHWYSTRRPWDGGQVQISTDHGETWTIITPEGDYPHNVVVGLGVAPGYTGESDSWEFAQFDLSEYAGEVVMFRFWFGAFRSTPDFGWFVDHLVVKGQRDLIDDIKHETEKVSVPSRYLLLQNYPNPFNPTTTLRFGLPQDSYVRLAIYDISGKLVRTLLNGQKESGYHSVLWNGKDNRGRTVNSGVYFYKIKTKEFSETKQMILLK